MAEPLSRVGSSVLDPSLLLGDQALHELGPFFLVRLHALKLSLLNFERISADQALPSLSLCWAFSLALAHRAITALRAISLLFSGVSLAARILPPLDPPSFPRATAFGFFFLAIDDLEANLPNG